MVIVRLASQFPNKLILRCIRIFLQLKLFWGWLMVSWQSCCQWDLGAICQGLSAKYAKGGCAIVPPAILQSDIFHTLTSQYGYRTMSYFDSRQFYHNIIHHYFLQCSWGQKTHQYRNICLQLGWHFALPKMAERIPCSKKYGRLPKLEEAPPPYLEISSTGALSSKGLIHGVVISQHCHSKPFLTTNASKTRNRI